MTSRRALPASAALIACALALSSCGDDQAGSPSANSSRFALSTSRWWMTGVTRNGIAVTPTGGRTLGGELRFAEHVDCGRSDPIECYEGPQMVGSDACNGVSMKVTVDADTVQLGEGFGVHTAMACMGPLPDALAELFRSPSLRYSIVGNHLSLSSPGGDIVATYDALTTPFGPADGTVVDDGSGHAPPYRLVWNHGLSVQTSNENPRGRFDVGTSAGVGVDPGRVNAMRVPVGGRPYLFAVVPATTARAVYEPDGGTAHDVAVHNVGDPQSKVVGEFVDDSNGWKLTAYDATGRVIHTLVWSPTS